MTMNYTGDWHVFCLVVKALCMSDTEYSNIEVTHLPNSIDGVRRVIITMDNEHYVIQYTTLQNLKTVLHTSLS
jgi:hypothetical protein